MGQIHQLNFEVLSDAHFATVYEMFDDLHTAISENQLQRVTSLNQRELVAWLNELVFTAQETIAELEQHSARSARSQPNLRLVK